MKKYYAVVFIIDFLLIAFITACSGTSTERPSLRGIGEGKVDFASIPAAGKGTAVEVPAAYLTRDMKDIKDKGKIVFGLYKNDMPPFFMTDENGELYGLDIEFANGMASKLGVEAVFDRSAASYRDLFNLVAEGKVDAVVAKFSRTIDRAQYIKFSTPYVELRYAIMMNKELLAMLKVEDNPVPYLRDNPVKIGVPKGTSYTEIAKELFPKGQVVEFENKDDMFQSVVNNDIAVCLYDENEFAKVTRRNSDIALYTTVYVFNDLKDYVCAAVPPESTQLLSWINTYIENGNRHWTINDLMNRYPEVYKIEEK